MRIKIQVYFKKNRLVSTLKIIKATNHLARGETILTNDHLAKGETILTNNQPLMKFLKPLFILAILTQINAQAQWTTDTKTNTPLTLAAKGQTNIHMATDANGGAIITWDDNRNSVTTLIDIYAQRIDKLGKAKWVANGIAISTAAGNQKSVNITETGTGDAIITWVDERSGNMDIYAQKIDSTGKALWAANGVVICNKATNQKNPKILNDNAGGAIIVWEDSVNFYFDIYAQRVNSLGVRQWNSNGIAVCAASNIQNNPTLDFDGLGGAIITWQDKRNTNDYDIYAQHIDSKGAALWKADGIAICSAINTQNNPRIEPDGNNGAIIAWADKRNGVDKHIYAQQINSAGTIGWTANGIVVSNAAGSASAIDLKYLGTHGALVCWKDSRNGFFQVFGQIINLSGVALLKANGILISKGLKAINPNAIASDNGAAIIVWQDSSAAGGWDIKSQKISKTGLLANPINETTVCNATDDQINADNISDGQGGCIFAWEDHRNGTDDNIFAQRLSNADLTYMVNIRPFALNFNYNLFPNPITSAMTKLNLSNPFHLVKNIEIINALGQNVLNYSIDNTDEVALDVSPLCNGKYIIKINTYNNTSDVINLMINR